MKKTPRTKVLHAQRRWWPWVFLPLLFLTPLVAAADQAEGLKGQDTAATAASGVIGPNASTQGTFGEGVSGWADPSTGASAAAYPFALPAARGVPQPQIRLRYNSNAGMGDAGPQWSFDLPVIERKPLQGGAPTYADDERMVFGGAPLVFIGEVTSTSMTTISGQVEPLPSWSMGWRYYRLLVDNHARFFWSPNRKTWRVQQKTGEIFELGEAIVYAELGGGSGSALDIDYATNGIVRWRLSRHFDHHCAAAVCTISNPANVIVYHWLRGGAGVAQVTDEYDTFPAGEVPTGPADLAKFAHHTEIQYEPNRTSGSSLGIRAPAWKGEAENHAIRVQVTGNGHERTRERAQLHLYELRYAPQTAAYRKAWALESIVESGPQAGSFLPKTTFKYNSISLNETPDAVTRIEAGLGHTLPTGPVFPNPEKLSFMDVDRNGTADIVQQPDDPNQPGRVYTSAHDHNQTHLFYEPLEAKGTSASMLTATSHDLTFINTIDFENKASVTFAQRVPGTKPNEFHYDLRRWRLDRIPVAPGSPKFFWRWASPTNGPAASIPDGIVGAADFDGNGALDMLHIYPYQEFPYVGQPEAIFHPRVKLRRFDRFAGNHDPNVIPPSYAGPYLAGDLDSANTGRGWVLEDNYAPFYAFADLNGDHVPDLVTRDDNYQFIYYPGNGRGDFRCDVQSGLCTVSTVPCTCGDPAYGCLPAPRPCCSLEPKYYCYTPTPWVSIAASALFFAENRPNFYVDYNKDGLDDIVQADTINGHFVINVWLNQDGKEFLKLDNIVPTYPTQPKRIGLGDINGNGTTDIIIIGTDGMSYLEPFPEFPGSQTSNYPGLLESIDNGLGGRTLFTYKSLHQVDGETAGSSTPGWFGRAPVATNLVSSVQHYQEIQGPGDSDSLRTAYTYRNPAYDAWEGRVIGFGEVEAASDNGSVTRTRYYFGECDGGCTLLRETDPKRALLGVPYMVEVSSFPSAVHSTTAYHYYIKNIYREKDGAREVAFAFPLNTDKYLYDNAPFQGEEEEISYQMSAGVTVPLTLASKNREHLLSAQWQDDLGNLLTTQSNGRMGDSGPIDTPIRMAYDGWHSVGNPDFYLFGPSSQTLRGTAADPDRVSNFTYDSMGQLTDITATLVGTLPLVRSHEHGDPIAQIPVGASVDGAVRLAHFDYDNAAPGTEASVHLGNVTRAQGPGSIACTETVFDSAYQHLLTSQTQHTGNGCTGKALTNTWVYSGNFFDLPSMVTRADHSVMAITYDGVGRVETVADSDPDVSGMVSNKVSRFSYNFRPEGMTTGFSGFSTQIPTSGDQTMTAWQFVDGFGATVASLAQGDLAAGDGSPWLVQGATHYRRARPSLTYRPYGSTADPAQHQLAYPQTFDGQIVYDGLNRVLSAVERGRRVERKYHALSIDTYDEEDLRQGTHANTPSTVTYDGHGRVASTMLRNTTPSGLDVIQTNYEYNPAGQVVRVSKQHSLGPEQITRWMKYDSLGRLVLNAEPNTSKNFVADRTAPAALTTMRAWRYAYDNAGRLVATSDARGCGKNIYYDALGRTLAEDFSPCLIHHEAYTPINLATGAGAEALYQYDASGILGGIGYYGRLTWAADRGAITHFAYDGRGRPLETARRITRPASDGPSPGQDSGGFDLQIGLGPIHIVIGGGSGGDADAGADPAPAPANDRYTPHLFRKKMAYDLANRLVYEDSGADVEDLLADGASAVKYDYSKSGRLRAINSSYGALVSNVTYNVDGTPSFVQYGDAAQTHAEMFYGDHEIDRYAILRARPTLWDRDVPPYYTKVDHLPPTSAQEGLASLKFDFDGVGNPTKITDSRNADEWPAGAKPKTQTFVYDDLYRLTSERADYGGGVDQQVSPFAAEEEDLFSPVLPRLVRPNRSRGFDISYDFSGNTTALSDNDSAVLDRSALGNITNGDAEGHPNQLTTSSLGIQVRYDEAGNVVEMLVPRSGDCTGDECSHHFIYDWDEVGQLVRARRWDYETIPADEPRYPAIPFFNPEIDVRYAYSQGQRVLKSVNGRIIFERHWVEVFNSLRLDKADFDVYTNDDYDITSATENAYLGGVAHVAVTEEDLPAMSGSGRHVFLTLGDQLGSTQIVLDHATGELAENIQYHPFGTVDSDYRPERWGYHREPYQFTGKEADIEVGLTYFGARYYSTGLARWMSADPLTIHAMGGDPNPYSYVGGTVMQATDPLGLDVCEVSGCSGSWWSPPSLISGGTGGGGSGHPENTENPNGNVGQPQQVKQPGPLQKATPPKITPSASGTFSGSGATSIGPIPDDEPLEYDANGTPTNYHRPVPQKSLNELIADKYGGQTARTALFDQRFNRFSTAASVVVMSMNPGSALARWFVGSGGRMIGAVELAPSLSMDVDYLATNARNIATISEDGYFNFVTHADANKASVLHNGQWVDLTHRTVAQAIKASGEYTGGPIRLIGCEAGACSMGLAQNLSNKLGVEVVAPTEKIIINADGTLSGGGAWRIFQPGWPFH